MRLPNTAVFLVASMVGWAVNTTEAGVIEFFEKSAWVDAVGRFETIPFTGFPQGTFITDQYADLGILFTDGNDSINFSPTAFPNDAWGLDGNGDISVSFEAPQAWIGVDFPGTLQIELFSSGRLFYTSSIAGGGGAGFFFGLISSDLFDAAVVAEAAPGLEAEIDDLHFGVPTPGALWLLALSALRPRRRRPR